MRKGMWEGEGKGGLGWKGEEGGEGELAYPNVKLYKCLW